MRQQVHLRVKAPRNPWVLPPHLTRAALPAYRITLWARDTRVGRQTERRLRARHHRAPLV